jgi:hypothetical protein
MMAISLHQPHASALFVPRLGGITGRMIKTNETRKRPLPPKHLGNRVAIHAAKRETIDQRSWFFNNVRKGIETIADSFADEDFNHFADLPFGCIIGTVIFMHCEKTEEVLRLGDCDYYDRIFGDWSPGRFAWKAMKVERFKDPVPCMGRQGWFNWNPDDGK